MLSVEEAVARIAAAFTPLESELVRLEDAAGRVLAEAVHARLDQPPAPVSAMDGYAVRSSDAGPRRVIGAAPAGHPFAGAVSAGDAVRIFTGGLVPEGADAIMIQEDAHADGDNVTFSEMPKAGRFIRKKSLDFAAGEILAGSGKTLSPRDLALLAAGDHAMVAVRRRPRIAFAATGDELTRAGETRRTGGIVASSPYGLGALIAQWGGEPVDLGIVPDRIDAVAALAERCIGFDLLLTLGGASVGDHDLIQQALEGQGFVRDFWKIAMRPGKPLIFGKLGAVPLIGLPGNPVSTLVCALLFVRPAIDKMLGRERPATTRAAKLSGLLDANDARQDYIRARTIWRDGALWATPHPVQDSAMLKILAQSDALILRAPHAAAIRDGDPIEIVPLD